VRSRPHLVADPWLFEGIPRAAAAFSSLTFAILLLPDSRYLSPPASFLFPFCAVRRVQAGKTLCIKQTERFFPFSLLRCCFSPRHAFGFPDTGRVRLSHERERTRVSMARRAFSYVPPFLTIVTPLAPSRSAKTFANRAAGPSGGSKTRRTTRNRDGHFFFF